MGVTVSIQGDVYSFGIPLMELFTGKESQQTIYSGKYESSQTCGERTMPEHLQEIMDNSALCEELPISSKTH